MAYQTIDVSDSRTYVTLSYTPLDGSPVKTITIRDAEWGNGDTFNPGQTSKRSRGGQLFNYNTGTRYRQMKLDFQNLSAQERADLEDFFGTTFVNIMDQWFLLTRSPTTMEVIQAGAKVNGVTVQAGAGFKAGQRILMDSYTWVAKLVSPTLDFAEATSDAGDYHFDLPLLFEVLSNLPSNYSE